MNNYTHRKLWRLGFIYANDKPSHERYCVPESPDIRVLPCVTAFQGFNKKSKFLITGLLCREIAAKPVGSPRREPVVKKAFSHHAVHCKHLYLHQASLGLLHDWLTFLWRKYIEATCTPPSKIWHHLEHRRHARVLITILEYLLSRIITYWDYSVTISS